MACEAQVTYGDIADEILKAAKFMEAGLIVMATHGRGGLAHLTVGSIARRVAQEAALPLLLVRPYEQPTYEKEMGRQPEWTEPAEANEPAGAGAAVGAVP